MTLDRAAPVKCPEWTAFFVEAVTDHVVWQSRPSGVVNEAQGEWLIARADALSLEPDFHVCQIFH